MPLRLYAAVSAIVVLLATTSADASAAPMRPALDASAAQAVKRAKLRLATMTGVPSSVTAGNAFRVRGRVLNLPGRLTESGRLTFTLRASTSRRAKLVRHLTGTNIRSTRASTSRSYSVLVRIPRTVKPGSYVFRACVRRGSGAGQASCHSKRLRVRARPTVPPPAPVPPPPAPPTPPGQGAGKPDGRHSLRPPLTGENFYFVMADRFENGDTANDNGGLPPGKVEGTSGFDPAGKGWYHGGDLEGLTSRIDYIQDLGTTAIWLTPSFKNKAVQDNAGFPSAGYHGYWITDFTQIDPHLGTNEDLRALVEAAHARGMKVFFDIITNHTADVITYEQGAAPGYVSKDRSPYRTAADVPFDDRDYAGTSTFPPLDPGVSFPFTPVNPPDAGTPGSQNHKVPAWLNDVTAYHNRGNTTFTGENAFYGDFFGLDDLFTEQPRVIDGMIDIYNTWIRDFRVDGFRIDTMKHVNDEFWQKFAPAMQATARSVGKNEFYAFGEVFDQSKQYTSHFTTQDNVQGVLDFPFQLAAQNFAARSQPATELGEFFRGDDWYTDADSNVYQLPTFLGNHDMGRFGLFVRQGNPGAGDPEVFARDRLGHELMYFSRGNPVVYYGDEQGFVGDGGDQLARQDMFASQVAEYNDDDLIGTDATTAQSNFDRSHVLYRAIARLADVTREHPALRNGAHQHRYAADGPGIYAFSRLARDEQHEYVVALNNSESEQTASIPTWIDSGTFTRIYGVGAQALRSGADKHLQVAVPPLSTVVYRSAQRIPVSAAAPSIAIAAPAEGGSGRDRLEVRADVGGDSFYEVTFEAKVGGSDWQLIGTDDNAPYRVFHDVSRLAPGTAIQYRATVLDNDRNQRTSAVRNATVAPPLLTLEAPREEGRVRGEVEVRATATPELAHYVVRFERQVDGGAWTTVGSDDSSPVYTAFDDTTGLPDGARVTYRAVLTYAPGQTVTSENTRTVTVVSTPVTQVTIHYKRTSDSNYALWGLHLFGDALAPGEATAEWTNATPFEGTDAFGVFHVIQIDEDTKQVGFIVHQRPPGNPDIKDTDADRFFVPLECPHLYVTQGQSAFECEATARP
ncbi:MAG: alpha-amylase [Solirubrobacteraceae bacterium]|nr:alpha-amylase [Solirubrobacteraceae bacterium]